MKNKFHLESNAYMYLYVCMSAIDTVGVAATLDKTLWHFISITKRYADTIWWGD